jgi:hypothetical protein
VNRFWRVIDAVLPASFRDDHPARRERGRLLVALCALSMAAALLMMPLDLIFMSEEPSAALAALLTAFGLLLVLRWTGWVDGVSTLFVVALAFLGSGLAVAVPEAESPYRAWVLVMGLTPLVAPNVRVTAVLTVAVVTASLIHTVAPLSASQLIAPGDVFLMIIVAWGGIRFVLDTHRMAHVEHAAARDAQRALEREIDAASRDLEAQAKETMRFLMTVSHELRTPLNGVLGVSSLLADEPDVPAGACRDLVAIQEAARSVLRIFDTLLCLTRATALGAKGATPADLPGLVDAAVTRAAEDFGERGRIRTNLAPELPRIILLDAGALKIILAQLIGSALDAGARDLEIELRCLGAELVVVLHGAAAHHAAATPLDLGLALVEELANEHEGLLTRDDHAEAFGVTITFPCRVAVMGGEALTVAEARV